MYPSWIGFNLSHSLGVVVSAAVLLAGALDDFTASVENLWFVAFAMIVPAAWSGRVCSSKPRNAIRWHVQSAVVALGRASSFER